MLTRETLLAPVPRRIILHTTTDGRQVYLRSLNELERSQYDSAIYRKTKSGSFEMDHQKLAEQPRYLITLCVCEESGRPLLTPADVGALGELDGGLIVDLAAACRKHCGFDRPAEDSEKNLPETSGSDSPIG